MEFECGSCGAKVTLYPRKQIVVERVFAWLMLPAIVPSLFFFASARRRERAWRDNPVAAGAPASAPREPVERICAACSGSARCTAIHRRQMWGIPVGTRYRYACTRCPQTFTVHDGRGIAFTLVIALVLTAAGALVVLVPPGAAVGAKASNRGFGVAMLVAAAAAWLALARQVRSSAKYRADG